MRSQDVLEKVFKDAWLDYRKNWLQWLIVMLLCIACFVIMVPLLGGIAAFAIASQTKASVLLGVVIALLALYGMIWIINLIPMLNALDLVFGRKMQGFSMSSQLMSYALLSLLYGLGVSFGMVLFFFPGLYLYQRWRFASVHLLEHNSTIVEAFYVSWHITRGKVLFLCGVSLLLWILNVVCAFTLVGWLFFWPYALLVHAHLYKNLSSAVVDVSM